MAKGRSNLGQGEIFKVFNLFFSPALEHLFLNQIKKKRKQKASKVTLFRDREIVLYSQFVETASKQMLSI